MNTIVYYHKNCSDGFGAAFEAWKHLGDDATYEPLFNGRSPKVAGYDRVFFVDVVPQPYDSIFDVARQTGQTIVIDHHKTSFDAFLPHRVSKWSNFQLRGVEFNFDMNHSAAVLTHQYFNPGKPTPWVAEYVEDEDLWIHRLAKSREVNAAIRSYPFTFKDWANFTSPNDMAKIGEHVLRTEKMYWERTLENIQWVQIGGYEVPIVNTTVNGSAAANAILERRHVGVAGYYFDRGDGVRQWGLRSNGKVDVSELAAKLGGGGHANAAGFQTAVNAYPRQEETRWLKD